MRPAFGDLDKAAPNLIVYFCSQALRLTNLQTQSIFDQEAILDQLLVQTVGPAQATDTTFIFSMIGHRPSLSD